jgi:hypothetical protein
MKFMNSDYGYANFASKRASDARAANRAKNVTTVTLVEPGGKLAVIPKSSKQQTKAQSKALKNTFAPPTVREPGMARNARSTAAGAKQGVRDATGWAGRRGIRSNIAGAKQGMRDGAYAGGQALKQAGRFIGRNKVGVGLAAAGALGAGIGATVLARKMRSDKGKKRGSYSK